MLGIRDRIAQQTGLGPGGCKLDEGRQRRMATEPQAWWLAATSFESPDSLARTVASLRDCQVDPDQMCIAARPAIMAQLSDLVSRPGGSFDAIAGLFKSLYDWPQLIEGQRVVSTSKVLSRAFLEARGNPAKPGVKSASASKGEHELDRQLNSGLALLIVGCQDGKQLSLVSRCLLSHSTDKVAIHLFSLPDG